MPHLTPSQLDHYRENGYVENGCGSSIAIPLMITFQFVFGFIFLNFFVHFFVHL